MAEHPLRAALSNEVHARPHEELKGAWRVTHFAMFTGEAGPGEDRALLADLLAAHDRQAPPDDAVYLSVDLGDFRLRWERHTEFSTWTFLVPGAFDPARAFAQTALETVPDAWIHRLPGQRLVAMHVAVDEHERTADQLSGLFGARVVGSRVGGGAGAVYTDFLLHDDGFSRALIVNRSLTPGQAGRTVQRLLEIETYRMMALLAFPQARETGPGCHASSRDWRNLMAELAEANGGDPDRDRRLLGRLTEYAAENERLLTGLNFRLSASRAYHAIVRRAVADLREERIEGLQTLAEFLARRLSPAMNTCEYVGGRMETLSKRLTRAGDMLRTRVDIALGENNRDLLYSMNRRAELQLRLQETVEGLSVVAISYYLLGLLGHAAKGLKAVGLLPVDPAVAVLAGLPLVVALVLVGVRRLRKAVTTRGH